MAVQSTVSSTYRTGKFNLLNIAILIGILFFAQDFFVPVVFAALLSFHLDPVYSRLEN